MARFVLSAFADEASDKLNEQLRICRANAIRFIEIRNVDNKRHLLDYTLDEVKELKRVLDDKGFSISSLGSPFGKIGIDVDFAPHLDSFKRGLEIANILGTVYMRIFSFLIPAHSEVDEYEDEVLKRLDAFLKESEGSGITLCHENEKRIFGENKERCRKLYDSFSGKLKLIFDPANFIQSGENCLEAYKLLEEGIEYLHIKDCMPDGTVVPAGKGCGSLYEILEMFSNKEGDRFLSLEPHLKVDDSLTEPLIDRYRSKEEAFNFAAEYLKVILSAKGFTQTKSTENNKWVRGCR